MATSIKISQLPAKGANLEATDLLEVSEFNGTGYVSKSITGQEIIDSVGGGAVTDVTGTAPISSSGGTTPDISMAPADTGHDGYLTSTDWNTFDGKQESLVSGTNIKTLNGDSLLGSGGLSVQPTLVSGTNIKTLNGLSLLGSGGISVEPSITAGTTVQYFRGDKSFQTLDKTAVGLANVDNTTDANKPVSTATQTALNLKQDTLVSASNIKTINGSSILGGGDLVVSGGGGGLQGIHALYTNIQGSTGFGFNALLLSTFPSSIATSANRLDVYPFAPNGTLTNCSITIGVVTLGIGVSARILIYSNVNSFPNTKLYESANIDCSTTGDKTVLTGLTFTAGVTYWLGFYCNGVTTLRALPATSMLPINSSGTGSGPIVAWSRISTTFGSAPTTFNYNTTSQNPQVNMFIKPT